MSQVFVDQQPLPFSIDMDISPTNDLSATSAQSMTSATTSNSKATEKMSTSLQLDADVGRFVSESFDSVDDIMTINDISITELLSTCIDACRRGCEVIRNVRHKLVQSSNVVGSDSQFFCCSAVKYKISNDPRSALTEADEASQKVITECLNDCWGKEIRGGLIKIVGEEDEGADDFVDSVSLHDMMAHFDKYNSPSIDQEPIQRDLLSQSDNTHLLDSIRESSNEKNELIIFIDPMDGTREFVENRIENVQCLIGITLNGKPIAGAVGMPMIHENKIEIAYGIDLPSDNEQSTSSSSMSKFSGVKYFNALNPLVKRSSVTDTGMGDYIEGEDDIKKLVILSGDSKKPALAMAMKCLKRDVLGSLGDSVPPTRKIIAGGCGNKMLFVQRRFEALSERIRHQEAKDLSSTIGSISLAPPGSSSWDTAGPTALLLAADPNAIVTDLVGRPLVYDGVNLSNDCGVVVSAGHMATRIHREMCEKLRSDEVFCKALGVGRCNAEII